MKWVLRLALLLILLLALGCGAGFLIPAHHILSRTVTLHQSPGQIFTLLTDLPNLTTWYHGVKKVEMLPPIDGKEASRQTMDGNMVMTIITTESVPPKRLVRSLGDDKAPFSGSWMYEITPTAEGSRVLLTEDATVPNPMFRLLVKLAGPSKYLDENLRDLGNHFGEKVEPQ